MRIGFLSDIHVDINYSAGKQDLITPALADIIKNEDIDVFITAGDISSDHELTLSIVDQIEKKSGRSCLFISGNHDLWNDKYPGSTAMDSYFAMVKHPNNISTRVIPLTEAWSVIGDTCWYDYSFGTHQLFTEEDFARRAHKGRVWQDSIKALWNTNDKAVHDWFLSNLSTAMKKAGDDNLIAVTHMLPIREFTVPVPNRTWDYFNAFLGSEALGQILLENSRVKYSVSGHVHYRKSVEKGGIHFICQCLGYRKEWRKKDTYTEIRNSIKVIEI